MKEFYHATQKEPVVIAQSTNKKKIKTIQKPESQLWMTKEFYYKKEDSDFYKFTTKMEK